MSAQPPTNKAQCPRGNARWTLDIGHWTLCVLPLLAACGGAVADHETLGDRAYAEGRFGDALVEYRLALAQGAPSPRLRMKAGQSALHVGDLLGAAAQYAALGREGAPDEAAQAAEGLVWVADRAMEDRDQEALAAAVTNLHEIAPGRALGGFAHQLVRNVGQVPQSSDALSLLLYAAAGAPDARTLDSLMFGYARVLRRVDRCEEAIPLFESLLRRRREPAVVPEAENGLAMCALSLGKDALDRNSPTQAEEWFRRAATGGGQSAAARAAYIGLGDVHFAMGDYEAAAEAYFRAMEGAALGDSIAAQAVDRLNLLGRAEPRIP